MTNVISINPDENIKEKDVQVFTITSDEFPNALVDEICDVTFQAVQNHCGCARISRMELDSLMLSGLSKSLNNLTAQYYSDMENVFLHVDDSEYINVMSCIDIF